MSDGVWSAYGVTFPIDLLSPYTAADAGLRVTVHTERWNRLDDLYETARERLNDLTDMLVSQLVAEPTWPRRVAHQHARLCRLQAAQDEEAACAEVLVYQGPRQAGRDGRWQFEDWRRVDRIWRGVQQRIAAAVFPLDAF